MLRHPSMLCILLTFPLAKVRNAADILPSGDPADNLTGLRPQEDASLKVAPGPKLLVQA